MKALKLKVSNPLGAVAWAAFLLPVGRLGSWAEPSLLIAVACLGCAVMYTQPSPWESREPALRAGRFFALLQLLYVISYLYSLAFNGVQTGARDLLDLPRYALLGVCAVYLIRHFDDAARRAFEAAMAASVYLSWAVFDAPGARGYALNAALCYYLFFSRSRWRWVHAAAAVVFAALLTGRASWAATLVIVCAAGALALGRRLERWGVAPGSRGAAVSFAALLTLGILALRVLPPPRVDEAPSFVADPAEYVRRSPLLGWGPALYEPGIRAADQYRAWLLKSGFAGAALICGGLLYAGYRLMRGAADEPQAVGTAAFMAAVALMLLSGGFLDSFRLFLMTGFFAAGIRAVEARP